MSEVTGFSFLFTAVGLLFIGLSIPLMLDRVPPNRFYGCRTARSLSDPKVWYAANRVFGKNFLISGILVFTASVMMLAFGRAANPDYVVITLLSVLVLSLGWAGWHCFRQVGRV